MGPFNVEGNRGHSKFDGVYVTGKVRHAKATVIATYAWTKANNLATDFGTVPSDITNQNFEQDWGNTPNDVRHRGTLGAVWQLPALFQVYGGAGQHRQAVQRLCRPRGPARAGARDRSRDRTDVRANSFRAGSFFSWDLRLSKMFNSKDKQIEALFEVFNLTNHANFNRDDYVHLHSPNFGNLTSVLKNSQRQAEFGLRFGSSLSGDAASRSPPSAAGMPRYALFFFSEGRRLAERGERLLGLRPAWLRSGRRPGRDTRRRPPARAPGGRGLPPGRARLDGCRVAGQRSAEAAFLGERPAACLHAQPGEGVGVVRPHAQHGVVPGALVPAACPARILARSR
jgi:hypothetical protein